MNLAVGFFDGIHLGHRRILSNADAVLTFRNHPTTVFAPERSPALIMTSNIRLNSLTFCTLHSALCANNSTEAVPTQPCTLHSALCANNSTGSVPVLALEFTSEFAAQTAEEFVEWLRIQYPDLETIYCGDNWTFGAGAAGNAQFLRDRGLRVEVVPYAEFEGEAISSTRIRRAIEKGEMERSSAMLGRDWCVEGIAEKGKGLGRTIGFPTINLRLPEELVRPPRGVYAVDTPFGPGIANYGVAPSLGENAWPSPMLEVHVISDKSPGAAHSDAGSLGCKSPNTGICVAEGQTMAISFKRFIRPEQRFESIGDLILQIREDVNSLRR